MRERRRAGTLAVVCALAALGGCATPVPGPSEVADLTGRLAVSIDAQPPSPARSMTAQFELRGGAEQGEMQLSTPLGSTLARAQWGPGGAELTTTDGTTHYPDLNSLTQRLIGETLPLAALLDWLRGRPWLGATSQPVGDGRGFEQMGWAISLDRLDDGLVTARRETPPAVSVRARLDR